MAKVTCLPNGPLLVEGPVDILDSAGRPFECGGRPRLALCRCGVSKNKPFCDGAHKAGFAAEDTAPRKT